MRKIPEDLREEMAADPFYKTCCISGLTNIPCEGRVEWHHHIIYGGRQVNAKWAILPLCEAHHSKIGNPLVRDFVMWIALNRATLDELRAMSKAVNYIGMLDRLNKTYGSYQK